MNIKTFMVAAVAALTLAACAAEKEEELVATADEAVAETVANDEVTAEAAPAPEATDEAAQ